MKFRIFRIKGFGNGRVQIVIEHLESPGGSYGEFELPSNKEITKEDIISAAQKYVSDMTESTKNTAFLYECNMLGYIIDSETGEFVMPEPKKKEPDDTH